MSHIVANIQSFAEMNNMELNPDKCKDMIVDFLQFKSSVLGPIAIGTIDAETVSSFKLPGVYVTSYLTWSVHCEHIIKKCVEKVKQERKCFIHILLVYCTIIRSILEYASVVFANLPQSRSNDLEKVQKRALIKLQFLCSHWQETSRIKRLSQVFLGLHLHYTWSYSLLFFLRMTYDFLGKLYRIFLPEG